MSRHTNAAVAGGVTWQESFMHTDTAGKSHEMMHFRPLKKGACGWLILGDVDIGYDHITISVNKIAIQVGFMPLIFLDHFEITCFGWVLLIASRKS